MTIQLIKVSKKYSICVVVSDSNLNVLYTNAKTMQRVFFIVLSKYKNKNKNSFFFHNTVYPKINAVKVYHRNVKIKNNECGILIAYSL